MKMLSCCFFRTPFHIWVYGTEIPTGSMYGIYANIWGILMVNATIYGIHGSYGISVLFMGVTLKVLNKNTTQRHHLEQCCDWMIRDEISCDT